MLNGRTLITLHFIFGTFFTFIIKYFLYPKITYIKFFWIASTIINAIYKLGYIQNYRYIKEYAKELKEFKRHIWEYNFDYYYLLPYNFGTAFYAEYGQYADREYIKYDPIDSINIMEYSQSLEHIGISLPILSLYLLTYHINNYPSLLTIVAFNSLLTNIVYLGKYLKSCKTPNHCNYNTELFPRGFMFHKRPLIYSLFSSILFTLSAFLL